MLACSNAPNQNEPPMRPALLLALVLAVASRALAGGAGGEFAVDVRGDGEPLHDAAFDAEGGGGTASEPAGDIDDDSQAWTSEVEVTEEEGLDHADVASASQRRAAEAEALEAEALAAAWAADADPEPELRAPDPLDEEKRRKLVQAEDAQWARERRAYADVDRISAQLDALGAGDYDAKTRAKRQGLQARLTAARTVVAQLEERGARLRAGEL